MRSMIRRIGTRVRRRWIWVGAAGTVGGLVLLFLPWRDGGASLELVALGGDGRFDVTALIPRQWADTSGLAAGAVVRVPLVLGVRNTGGQPATPTGLELNVPTRYRLARADGRPIAGQLSAGTPLVRYSIELPQARIDPGRPPVLIPALDTVWLEPIVPSFHCMTFSDSVPEFVPAPPAPVEVISRVRIFYSFEGETLDRRQTGLLTVQLDPGLLRQEIPEPPPVYPAEYREPKSPLPAFSALRYVGHQRAFCGEPEYPIEILSTTWETLSGGRFIVLDHGGAPRKYLFDLDRDSIIELEMWDPDSDGDFEARRPARLPIPAFLLPPPGPAPFDLAILDAIPEDSLYRYDRYTAVRAGPYRYRTRPPDTAPRRHRFRPLVLQGTSDDEDRSIGTTRRYAAPSIDPATAPRLRGRPVAPPVAPGEPLEQGEPARPGDRAAPRREVAPDRREPVGRPVPDRAVDERRPAQPEAPPERVDRPAPAGPPARAGEAGAPKPQPREEPKLLGRPVDSIRPPPRPRPDTTGTRR